MKICTIVNLVTIVTLYICIEKYINMNDFTMVTMEKIVTKYTTMYIRKDTKKDLDGLKMYGESREACVRRLIRRRNFDIIGNELVERVDKKEEGEHIAKIQEKEKKVFEGEIGK